MVIVAGSLRLQHRHLSYSRSADLLAIQALGERLRFGHVSCGSSLWVPECFSERRLQMIKKTLFAALLAAGLSSIVAQAFAAMDVYVDIARAKER